MGELAANEARGGWNRSVDGRRFAELTKRTGFRKSGVPGLTLTGTRSSVSKWSKIASSSLALVIWSRWVRHSNSPSEPILAKDSLLFGTVALGKFTLLVESFVSSGLLADEVVTGTMPHRFWC